MIKNKTIRPWKHMTNLLSKHVTPSPTTHTLFLQEKNNTHNIEIYDHGSGQHPYKPITIFKHTAKFQTFISSSKGNKDLLRRIWAYYIRIMK